MAENKNKTKYKFGSQEFDGELYLRNLKDNAQGFLNSQTTWTPELKEEWKHSYTNYMNALSDDIANGGGRFSTDEFGSIVDNKGEFSNTDDDNFLYNKKGELINLEQYDLLKKRKLKKYSAFTSNLWFASYANLVGKKLAQALAEKKGDSTDDSFDYAKNGFAAYWQKKYNPAGDSNDASMYWKMDKDGLYGNRINLTVADLNDYIANSDIPDNVKLNIEAYRDTLQQYSTDKKFDLDTWKNNVNIAASKAGLNSWNSGFFNFGNLGAEGTPQLATQQEHLFDINNDEDVLNRYPELRDLIAAYPELRDRILANARATYNKKLEQYIAADNKRIADENWANYLKLNPLIGDVRKRQFNANHVFNVGTTFTGNNIISLLSARALQELGNALGGNGASDDYFLAKITNPMGAAKIGNLGLGLAYYLPYIEAHPEYAKAFNKYIEKVLDAAGNSIYKVRNSKNLKGEYLYFIRPKNQSVLKWYRSKSYLDMKAGLPKGLWGFKVQTLADKLNAIKNKKEQADLKILNNPNSPKEQKLQVYGKLKAYSKNTTLGMDAATTARAAAAALDIGSMIAAYMPGVGTVASAGLGVGSTLANFGADIADNSTSWGSAFGNLGIGLGLDAVGLIPGIGTGAKATKLARVVSKFAPTALTILGAQGALTAESRASWKKVFDSPSSMTVLDWRNIANGVSVIAGGARGVAGHLQAHTIKAASNTGKFKITSKSGKELELSKDLLEQLLKTKTVDDANKLLSKWHPGEEVATKVSSKWLYLRHPSNANNRLQVANIKPTSVFGTLLNTNINKKDLRYMSKLGSWGERLSFNPLSWVKNPYKVLPTNSTPSTPSSTRYTYLRTQVTKPLFVIGPSLGRPYSRNTTTSNFNNATPPRPTPHFKEGGNILKYADGGITLNSVGYTEGYNWNNDVFSKNIDHILGSLKKYDKGYANWLNQMLDLHYTDYSNASKLDYLNTSAYNASTVGLYLDKYKAGYEDEWDVSEKGNDPSGIGYNLLGIKSTQEAGKFGIVSKLANSGDWLGGDNEYRTDNSFGGITDARRLLGRKGDFTDELFKLYLLKFKDLGWDYYLDDKTNYYKLRPIDTPSNPLETDVVDKGNPETPKTNILDSIKLLYNSLTPTDKWGIPRAIYADRTNRAVTDLMRQTPLLLDPQEDHRYVLSDLDSEINGLRAAGQYNLSVSLPISADANLLTMAQLDATIKGLDIINLGRQQSNLVLRQMAELAWLQEKENHTNRHNTAMLNRQSIWQTNLLNRLNEAAYLNLKFTIWDALAQEKEFDAKLDYELKKSRIDLFVLNDINNSIKYGLSNYKDKYKLDDDDLALWAAVYVDGTKKLSDILKNPEELKRWNKLLNATRLILQDSLRNYYGIAPSLYYTIPTASGDYINMTSNTKKQGTPNEKQGGTLNIKKVREAAKGEKLAAALLKAATADADRFNKSVNSFIDRSYDAVDRIRLYSKKKKKRKKN